MLVVLAACRPEGDELRGASGPAVYAVEYPAIGYAEREPAGRVGRLLAGDGRRALARAERTERGYLEALLATLGIDASSQTLVFSRTSKQTGFVRAATPRAIYFNDDSYVAWIPGAPAIEIAHFDPELGPVFFTLSQDAGAAPVIERHLEACLRCHDSYSLSGGGVPRFLLGSGYTGANGELVSHEAWILTDQSTPLRFRWGGWYVTGRHGTARHLGNIVVARIEDLQDLESLRVGNLDSLDGLVDTSAYLTPYSDIVALLVLEHQVEIQNLISRLRFETVGRLAEEGGDVDATALAGLIEPLVRALLMSDEAPLGDRISDSSGFTAHFESLGPFDSGGRSLRELDLSERLFRYPLSYLIYSDGIAALPATVRDAIHARLRAILGSEAGGDDFPHLSAGDRQAIAAILQETLPGIVVP